MERIVGKPLAVGWMQRSQGSKDKILQQLGSLIREMRSLETPNGTGVSNISGGPIFDLRLPNRAHWGPFNSIHDFHRELRNGIEPDNIMDLGDTTEELKDLVKFHERPWETPVFTHGDLSSLNVLAQGDRLVAIIDWETAGWMPSYWEYTSAWDTNPQNRFWQKEVDKFLEPHQYALKMETIRKKYFGDF